MTSGRPVFNTGSEDAAADSTRRASETGEGRRGSWFRRESNGNDTRRGSWFAREGNGIDTRRGVGEGYTTHDGAMIKEGDNTIDHKYEKQLKEKIRVGSIGAAADEERRASTTGGIREGRRDSRRGSEGRRGSKGIETRQGIGQGYPTPAGSLIKEGDNTIDHKYETQLKEKIRLGSISAEAEERRASQAGQVAQ